MAIRQVNRLYIACGHSQDTHVYIKNPGVESGDPTRPLKDHARKLLLRPGDILSSVPPSLLKRP